ncbi:nucleophosmin 1b [Takifugu rubripes]|uniref:Nucleophosmin n=1 Tax=Takifugu rubripes TaxID=31033 RepID=H2T6F4_TAKRU|nr:nucleophosmin-like [Takifugu rubripes]XP_029703086.1 nucleophosmin-like [Takifugu rubripes]
MSITTVCGSVATTVKMEDDFSDLSRPQIYLFGCTLKSDKREFKIDVEDDDTEQQLSLKAVCVGAEAEDNFHMVEIEGLTYDGKSTKVPLAVLKPSIMPSMSLGGFEIMPPVTFRLQAGSGPVHISGQHFIRVKDGEEEEEEEENNTSPVKRPLSLVSGKKPPLKKLKMDSDDEDDSEEDDDDDEDDDSDGDVKPQKKTLKKIPDSSAKKTSKTPVKQNGPAEKPSGSSSKPQMKTPAPGKDKAQAGPSKSSSLPEIKNKLSTAAKEGKPLPKTEQKFENFVKSSFKITDKKVVKDLWAFVQSLKIEKK